MKNRLLRISVIILIWAISPVTTQTLFGIASNTKAMTATGLGMLVDEKKLSWDTKVTDIIPEFQL